MKNIFWVFTIMNFKDNKEALNYIEENGLGIDIDNKIVYAEKVEKLPSKNLNIQHPSVKVFYFQGDENKKNLMLASILENL